MLQSVGSQRVGLDSDPELMGYHELSGKRRQVK